MLRTLPLMLAALGLATAMAGCGASATDPPTAAPGGDAAHGKALIGAFGCGACHEIPGVSGADGLVGPPLTSIGRRTVIAGVLPNTPENLEHWLMAPQSVVPGNAMPDMGIKQDEARDVAAYLYTLR